MAELWNQGVKDRQPSCSSGKGGDLTLLPPPGAPQELGCSFSEIAVHDSEKLLRAILSSQQPDWYKKAQAFITNQGLEPGAVAELVAEEITRELLAPSEGRGSESTRGLCLGTQSWTNGFDSGEGLLAGLWPRLPGHFRLLF